MTGYEQLDEWGSTGEEDIENGTTIKFNYPDIGLVEGVVNFKNSDDTGFFVNIKGIKHQNFYSHLMESLMVRSV